ncbi:hypothetical protein M413DRAFT_438898 [Hebeloma cylindrosporum]|uniref:Uncharacterized protein n=1 Tax=Hebeloma cylindrosporum TaxID=76867 RepID=A0A0C3CM40_HEBCY|nr:hypothetical protein M413DRAFT_438898 [Hebeloma cylindrosporum h7]
MTEGEAHSPMIFFTTQSTALPTRKSSSPCLTWLRVFYPTASKISFNDVSDEDWFIDYRE